MLTLAGRRPRVRSAVLRHGDLRIARRNHRPDAWLYITGLAILAGCRDRARITARKNRGEQVPGQRKKIGARAARAFAEAGGAAAAHPPVRRAPPPSPAVAPRATGMARYFPGVPIFLVTWFMRRRRTRE